MTIISADAKRALRRGTRSANRAIDTAHDVTQRRLSEARQSAEDAIDAGDRAARQVGGAAKSAHAWMEEQPHLAALIALAAGVLIGAILSPRR